MLPYRRNMMMVFISRSESWFGRYEKCSTVRSIFTVFHCPVTHSVPTCRFSSNRHYSSPRGTMFSICKKQSSANLSSLLSSSKPPFLRPTLPFQAARYSSLSPSEPLNFTPSAAKSSPPKFPISQDVEDFLRDYPTFFGNKNKRKNLEFYQGVRRALPSQLTVEEVLKSLREHPEDAREAL